MPQASDDAASRALRVQFVVTSLPVGGAETLLLNLIRNIDKSAFSPEVVCLKDAGALGEDIAREVPLHANLIRHKWDVAVVHRLAKRFRGVDAVITVGAGDKMFWGRIAAYAAGVPVICSALHSTGWPDGIGLLNRSLTGITDGFIACAQNHAEYLAGTERLPAARVFLIPNGVDTDRFRPNHTERGWLREELDLPGHTPIVGIVAALRPEKNLQQFVEAAQEVLRKIPTTHFVIVGDGPERAAIVAQATQWGIASRVHLLGSRHDTERILAGLDAFCLTSRNEANPVSILEALACGVPVVSPDVGSISETVQSGKTGWLTKPLCAFSTADALLRLLSNPPMSARMGLEGRQLVRESWSLENMVYGYERLIENLFNDKAAAAAKPLWIRPASCPPSPARSRSTGNQPQPAPAPQRPFPALPITNSASSSESHLPSSS